MSKTRRGNYRRDRVLSIVFNSRAVARVVGGVAVCVSLLTLILVPNRIDSLESGNSFLGLLINILLVFVVIILLDRILDFVLFREHDPTEEIPDDELEDGFYCLPKDIVYSRTHLAGPRESSQVHLEGSFKVDSEGVGA